MSEPQIQGSAAGPVDDECEQDDDQDHDHQPEEEHDDCGNCVPAYGSGSSHFPQLPGAARIIRRGVIAEPSPRPPALADSAAGRERGGYHSDTIVGMVVSARKPEPGRAAIAR